MGSTDATSAPKAASIRRVLVIFKASKLERYVDRGSLHRPGAAIDEDTAAVFARLDMAHEEHIASVTEIEAELERSGLDVIRAAQPRKRDAVRADLVISVGGDGTFLWCANKVERTPMLGVNSAPMTSTGHYCAATRETFAQLLDAIRSGDLAPTALMRIAAEIGGERVPYPALNEVLFCHRSPAASSRYLITVGEGGDDDSGPYKELQVSSGVWVATPSGSTGAIYSAGGERMVASDHRMQFLVREPYERPGMRLSCRHGYARRSIELLSRSPSNAIFLDGAGLSYPVPFGTRVTLRPDDVPLWVYGYHERVR